MLFTFATLIFTVIFFLGLFTGGKSFRDVREQFYGNYYAEDGLINQTDKPNTPQAFQNCIDNKIGIKTELFMTADNRIAISTYADLSKEYNTEKSILDCTMDQLEELGIMSLTDLIKQVDGQVPVILEIKAAADNRAMCRAVADIIIASKHKNIAVCSFNTSIMAWFKEREKNIFRGVVSAPAKEFKNLSKTQRWMTGNLAYNMNCRPNFMLYRNRPLSAYVKFAAMSGVLKGVWTLDNAQEAKALEEDKELIIVRGFMPETVHFKDLPAAPAPVTPNKMQPADAPAPIRQRSISEILADDEGLEEASQQDGVFDELEAEVEKLFIKAKEEVSEAIEEVKEEIAELKEKAE